MGDVSRIIKHDDDGEAVNFEDAISQTGYGKFHYETLLVCALCIISIGFENGLSGYVFTAAQCELNLTSFQLGILNVSFLIGGTLSSFFWGILADAKGRKPILVSSLLINAAVTLICSINRPVLTFIICRFLNGFLIGAPGSIIFSYLAEFQPPKYRSSVICYSGLFFTSSLLLLPLLAWIILPLNILVKFSAFTLSSWRLFFALLAIPEIVAGLWMWWRLPESPKFHLAKGNTKKALNVLRKIYSTNTGKDQKDYPIKRLLQEENSTRNRINSIKCRGKFARMVYEILGQFKILFTSPLLIITILTCAIMFMNMLGVFGLGLWLPELFIRFERFQVLYPNKSVTVQELTLLKDFSNSTNCSSTLDFSVIQSTIAIGLTSLVGNVLSGYFASRVQLKSIPIVTMLMGGLSAGSIYFLKSATQNLIVAAIFQAAMVTANMTIGSVAVELFPTSISAIAFCLIMCAGRTGAMTSNFLFGLLMDQHCEIPIFVVAIGALTGAALCCLIPTQVDQTKSNCNGLNKGDLELSVVSNPDGLKL